MQDRLIRRAEQKGRERLHEEIRAAQAKRLVPGEGSKQSPREARCEPSHALRCRRPARPLGHRASLATRGAVAGFGDISTDNRRIITMEWIVEGAAQPQAPVSSAVYAVAIGTLVVLAVVSLFTGFKVAFLPYRLCPVIFCLSAALIACGAWL